MQIGYDAKRMFNNLTGLGNYSRAVVDYISEYFPSYDLHLYTPEISLNEFGEKYTDQNNTIIHTANNNNSLYWRTYGIGKEVQNQKIDIYHGLTHELPRNIHQSSCANVVTIHDLIFKRHPEYFPVTDRVFYNLKWKHALKNADKIIAISEHTKSDIIEFYGVPSKKIEVIYNTCHPRFYNVKGVQNQTIQNLPDRYILSLGSIEPRKNYGMLIKSLALIPTISRPRLVIAGRGKTKYVNQIKTLIQTLNLQKYVNLRSDISNDQIIELYQRAELFIYPSHYEGHGLPITEALLCNTPVISSETSSMKEAGGPSCIYINPNDPHHIALEITNLLENKQLKNSIIKQGKEYVETKFDISRIARQMNTLYSRL